MTKEEVAEARKELISAFAYREENGFYPLTQRVQDLVSALATLDLVITTDKEPTP